MSLKFINVACAAGLLLTAIPATAQRRQVPMRFQEMDANHDGRITRGEWRGSDRSFRVHDWNNDGVLSGDELRIGASRPGDEGDDEDFDSPNREYEFRDW